MDYANQIFTQIESIHEMLFKVPLWVDAKEGRLTTNQLKGLLKESYHSGGSFVKHEPPDIELGGK